MNNKKRNQLIGFITLVLFALLVAPYVITDKPQKTESTIPLLPQVNTDNGDILRVGNEFDIADNPINNPVIYESVEQFNEVPQVHSSNQTTEVIDTNNVTQQTEKGYAIQLVALKNKQKIEELIALLRLNNYDVYTVPQMPKDGQIIRLLVGAYPTKEQAELVTIDLENLTKLKGFVTTKQ